MRLVSLPSLDDVGELRTARIASLTALPELFLELEARKGVVHGLRAGSLAGYVVAQGPTLVEMFTLDRRVEATTELLRMAMDQLGLQRAWATTFDPVVLSACEGAVGPGRTVGLSFRTLGAGVKPPPPPRPIARIARDTDLDDVLEASHPDIFGSADEARAWIGNGHLWLFEQEGAICALGLCTPTGSGTRACDVGVRVVPASQRRGLGAWVIQEMVGRARAQGLVPTAGCAADNLASKRTLERAGFTADHELREYDLRGGLCATRTWSARPAV
ncbi:MAG: GNAT family N-acetyltransferase [Planctomycetota bacterium]